MRLTDPSAVPGDVALVMDTHVWVWSAQNDPARVCPGVFDLLERAAADGRLFASAASVWEIALKAAKGELLVGTDLYAWLADQRAHPGVRLVSITPALGIDATLLPAWVRRTDGRPHKDPNDRFIVATTRKGNAVLVTADAAILDYADDGHLTALDARP